MIRVLQDYDTGVAAFDGSHVKANQSLEFPSGSSAEAWARHMSDGTVSFYTRDLHRSRDECVRANAL